MLRSLEVEDLAVLRRVRLDFGPGLNVLSGETGAGKSLLLDALQLALGARGGAELVRPGSARARVAALFEPAGEETLRRLGAEGVEPEDGAVLLAREVGADGRGVCRINGRLATLATLRRVGAALVAVVGQGEQHRFGAPGAQLAFLDAFAGPAAAAARDGVRAAHAAWQATRREAEALGGGAGQRRARAEALAEVVRAIDEVAPEAGEEERLAARRRSLAHAERLLAAVEQAMVALREGDDAVADRLGRVRRELDAAARLHPPLRAAVELLDQALIALGEAAHVLGRERETLELEPGEAEALEARWSALERLKRRFGDSLEEVRARRTAALAELQALGESERRAGELAQLLAEHAARLGRAAAHLGALRREAAAKLEAEVAAELAALGMPGAVFRVRLECEDDEHGVPLDPEAHAAGAEQRGRRVACGPEGAERCTFLWSANPGLPVAPLARAASGGEMARLLLALHALRAAGLDVPTVVFDEIDAGIGGRAAAAVAERLQRLGAERQVLCVTHTAVIAAAADRHVAIEKRGGGTTAVRALEGEARALEVARMLDGGRGPASRAHAVEMLRRLARPAG